MARQIILRRGTAVQWTTANPVLANGEAGYDTTNKQLKIGDGVSSWDNLSPYSSTQNLAPSSLQNWRLKDLFVSGNVTGSLGWTASQAGTGAGSAILAPTVANDGAGIVRVDTGTTTTGRAGYLLSTANTIFGNGRWKCGWRVLVEALAIPAENFHIMIGWGDNSVAGDNVDGVYFYYVPEVSDRWLCVTASNSVRTTVMTTVPVVAGAPFELEIEVNASGTEARFYYDGVLVATIDTNIPVGTGRNCGILSKIQKFTGVLERAYQVRRFYLDWDATV